MLAVRAIGTKGTAELTITPALFIRGTPSSVLGDHRPATADGKRGCSDRRYT
jgi:hypothetical protein